MIKVRPIEKASSVFHMIASRKRCNRFHSLYEIVCAKHSSDQIDVFCEMFSLLRLLSLMEIGDILFFKSFIHTKLIQQTCQCRLKACLSVFSPLSCRTIKFKDKQIFVVKSTLAAVCRHKVTIWSFKFAVSYGNLLLSNKSSDQYWLIVVNTEVHFCNRLGSHAL